MINDIQIKLNEEFEINLVPGDNELINLLESVLLFYTSSPFDSILRTAWFNRIQTSECTTKVLCNKIREVLTKYRNGSTI